MTLDQLALALYAKTSEKKLDWSMNGASQISLKEGHNLVEINEVSPNSTYQLLVRNKDGIILDSSFYDQSSEVGLIFTMTKRRSLRVDEELEQIMKRIAGK